MARTPCAPSAAGSGYGAASAASTARSIRARVASSTSAISGSATPSSSRRVAGDRERVAGEPPLDLLGRPVARRVGLRVAVVAVGLALEQRRPRRPSGRADGLERGLAHRPHVVAVDDVDGIPYAPARAAMSWPAVTAAIGVNSP